MLKTISLDSLSWTAADLRFHCHIDDEVEDTYLTELADVATEYIQSFTGLDYTDGTYDEYFYSFPCGKEIHLSKPGSVQSITYYDTDSTQQTWDSHNYIVVSDDRRTVIRPAQNVVYPETERRRDAVAIRFTVEAPSSESQRFRQAVYAIVNHLYENRSVDVDFSAGLDRLLNSLHQGGYL